MTQSELDAIVAAVMRAVEHHVGAFERRLDAVEQRLALGALVAAGSALDAAKQSQYTDELVASVDQMIERSLRPLAERVKSLEQLRDAR